MPAFRIVYIHPEARRPDSITASFRDLDQALDVFASRGVEILFIAEQLDSRRSLGGLVEAAVQSPARSTWRRSSFPLQRYSGHAMA